MRRCPSCGAARMTVFHRARGVPTNSCILLRSAEEARAYPRGDIELGFCGHCGFIANLAFDPGLTEYSARYEETQGFSPTFNAFQRELAGRLIERYDLHGKEVIEIGCGKGEFLMLLCELGGNRGVGFDPGVHVERIRGPAADRVRVIADFYSEQYAGHGGDFVACKMTLEHIQGTGDFVGTVRRAIGDRLGTVVFFQIPEATRIVRDCAFEDIYYEHCSYFSPGSLARLFRRSGFEVLRLDTEYAGQYLTIEARAAPMPVQQAPLAAEDDIAGLAAYTRSFPERLAAKLAGWRTLLDRLAAERRRVALWGAGSKAVAFLTTLEAAGVVQCGVDVNPHRQGHYLPGSGLPILGPDDLRGFRPDAVIVMNPIYREEIARDLASRGLRPELHTL